MSSTTQDGKPSPLEKRLETARKARDERLTDRLVPTVADVLLGALDALPDVPAQLAQVKAWAAQDPKGNLCVFLRQGVAQAWLAGPKADPFKRRMAA